MTIIELAAALGDALKADSRLIALEETRKTYEADEKVQKMLTEYSVQQKALENEAAKPDRDTHLIDMIQARADALYDAIVKNEHLVAMNEAQNDVNELMNMVNNTITFHITGEDPSACTHDCSTCGGCHH